MELLSPLSLGWLGLIVPLVVLYVLRRRRSEREVGSTLLWEAALRDMRAERPWKRLIPHLSLLLQILAIVAGALALARPAGAGRTPAGARIAVVVDTSASMAAREGGPTRLERAREMARSVARGLPPGGEMMLVEAGAEPTVAAPPSRDATALVRAVDHLRVGGGAADLEAAVALAAERLRGSPAGSRVLLLTDGAMDGEVPLDGRTAPVEVRQVGGAAENTAIVAVDVRARPIEAAPDRADVFVRLKRFADTAAELFVTASVEGGGVVASRRLRIEGGATESVVMPADLPPDADGRAAVLRVELSREGAEGTADALALDDVVVAPSPGARRLPVFLVGRAGSELSRVLRADREVELFATDLTALARREPDAPPLDGLVLYAGAVPAEAPPGDSVVVAPSAGRVFEVELGEPVRQPRIVTWAEEDPRLRFVTLSDVHLAAARPIRGAVARALVTTDAGPVVASIERPDGETTLIAFDPAQSDWPRQPSFVVFFRNLLERARSRRAAGGVAAGTLGEALRVPAPGGERVEVTTPGGARLDALSRGGVAIVPVEAAPGVYAVTVGRRRLHALRNLLDPAESDLRPRARFTRGGQRTTAPTVEGAEHRESWPWLAGGLLVVLGLEALWATRRHAT